MNPQGEKGNTGAAIGCMGAFIFLIGFCGTVGSFLFAAAEGRGRWTVFYGAIVWGVVQMVWGVVLQVQAGKPPKRAARKSPRFDEVEVIDDEEDDRPERPRRRRTAQPSASSPGPVVIGCLAAGGVLLLCLVIIAVVMIAVQSSDAPNRGEGEVPKNEQLAEPAAEDLGPPAGQTQIVGATNDPTFRDQAPPGGVLIGFDVGLAEAFGVELVRAIQPRYLTPQGEVKGRKFGTDFRKTVSVKAKPGYAVGGLNIKAGLVVNGFSVRFMRNKGDALDPADAYSSEWIGDQTGGNGPIPLGGDGAPIIGIIGRRNARECNGLGLLKR
jgi:hypothetical protein